VQKKYLKAPPGNDMSEAVEWHDLELMKATALAMISNGASRRESYQEYINHWTLKQAREFFKFNKFTFVEDPKEVTDVEV
jgi:hypothetical protein